MTIKIIIEINDIIHEEIQPLIDCLREALCGWGYEGKIRYYWTGNTFTFGTQFEEKDEIQPIGG